MWAGLTRICHSVVAAGQLRMLKPEGNQLLDKGIHQRVMIELENLPGHGGDTIQDRAAVLVTGGALFKEQENFSDKIVQILRFLLPEHQGQAAIDLDQGPAVDIGQGRDIDDMEKKIEFDQVLPAGIEVRTVPVRRPPAGSLRRSGSNRAGPDKPPSPPPLPARTFPIAVATLRTARTVTGGSGV